MCTNGMCRNLDGGFKCICNPGYLLAPSGEVCLGKCLDYSECQTTGMCTNGMCRNLDGGFKCICNPGYLLAPSGEVCIGRCLDNSKNSKIQSTIFRNTC